MSSNVPSRSKTSRNHSRGRERWSSRVEAAGLCHTDTHAAHGDWPVEPKLPLIPGHEGVGIVESVGSGVVTLEENQRVAVPWPGNACGVCEYCMSGWETLCKSQLNTGYSIDGSYAEYVKASAAYAAKVPIVSIRSRPHP